MPACLLCNPLPVSSLVTAIKRLFCVCNQQLQRSERERWADSTLVCERDSSLQKDAWCRRKCDFFPVLVVVEAKGAAVCVLSFRERLLLWLLQRLGWLFGGWK